MAVVRPSLEPDLRPRGRTLFNINVPDPCAEFFGCPCMGVYVYSVDTLGPSLTPDPAYSP